MPRLPAPTQRPPVAPLDPRPTVSLNGAAARAGVSRRTIYNWLAAGKLEWRRTAGGAVRIVEASLWLPGGTPTAGQAGQAGQAEATR